MAMSRAGRKRLILAGAVVLLAAVVAAGYGLKQARLARNMQQWLAEGNAAYERGDYEGAITPLSNYVSRDKTDVEVLLNFADARRQVPLPAGAHLGQAQSIVQAALAYEPDSMRGRVMLMEIYFDASLLTEARQAAEDVIKLDPTNTQARQIRIEALLRTNNTDDAIDEAIAMADAIPGDVDVQYSAFRQLLRAGAEPPQLAEFIAAREESLAGRLALELMRAWLTIRRMNLTTQGSPERAALEQELDEIMDRALAARAESATEATELIKFLDRFGPRNTELSDAALDRFLEDPALSADLAAFAAERLWSRGKVTEAGQLILEKTPDLAEASNELLGWLALTDVPEADTAREVLGSRNTPQAGQWLALSTANRILQHPGAGRSMATLPTRVEAGSSAGLLRSYLRGWAYRLSGETARAAREWEEVLELAPRWSIARRELGMAYSELGRLLDARETFLDDTATTGSIAHLRVEVAIDERGLARPEGSANSYQVLQRGLTAVPDSAEILALTARAALATGEVAVAAELADRLLRSDLSQAPAEVLKLATRLTAEEPAKAAALREAISEVATDPASILRLAIADARAGAPDRGRQRLEEHISLAPEESRAVWDTTLAMYLDEIDDPAAAQALLDLSAKYPDRLETQLAVLQADSTWHDPEPLGPVIDRLAAITGEDGALWRVYRGKRLIAMLDPDSPDARNRANGVLLELSAISNEDRQNAIAAETLARAAQIVGDTTRAADFLSRAARADPDNFTLRMELINTVLPRAGRLEEARRMAGELVGLPLASAGDLQTRAETLERYGLVAEAQADWDRLASAGSDVARMRLARTLRGQGRQEEADAIIEDLLGQDSLPRNAVLGVADYLAMRGRFDEGLALLETLPESDEAGTRVQAVAGYMMRHTETAEDARRIEARARATDAPELWVAAVQSCNLLGDLKQANRVLQDALAHHADDPMLATLARAMPQDADADPLSPLALLRSLLDFDTSPTAERIAALLDQRLSNQINDEYLITALSGLTEQQPGALIVWQTLATAQAVAGDLGGMADTYRSALAARPTDVSVAALATRHFDAVRLPEESFRAAREWRRRLGRPDYEADSAYALMLMNRDQAREALAAISPWRDRIIEARGEQPGDAYFYASVLARNGEDAMATDVMRPLADQSEDELRLCLALSAKLNDQDARRDWLEVLQPRVIASKSPDLLGALASSWRQWAIAGGAQPDDIRVAVEAAEELMASPGGWQVPVVLVAALGREALGEDEQAEVHYRALLELDPTLYGLRNNFAVLLLRRDNAAEALDHADTAVQQAEADGLAPTDFRSYLETQAQALLANDRSEDAITVFRRALEPEAAWPPGVLGLVRALKASGRDAEALRELDALPPETLSDEQASEANALRASIDE